jgi:hypothetical protein
MEPAFGAAPGGGGAALPLLELPPGVVSEYVLPRLRPRQRAALSLTCRAMRRLAHDGVRELVLPGAWRGGGGGAAAARRPRRAAGTARSRAAPQRSPSGAAPQRSRWAVRSRRPQPAPTTLPPPPPLERAGGRCCPAVRCGLHAVFPGVRGVTLAPSNLHEAMNVVPSLLMTASGRRFGDSCGGGG